MIFRSLVKSICSTHECGSMLWFIRLYTMTEIFAMSKILVYRDKPINFKRLLSLNITNTHIRSHQVRVYVCTNSTITFLESDHSSIWLRGPFLYHPLSFEEKQTHHRSVYSLAFSMICWVAVKINFGLYFSLVIDNLWE